MREIIRQFKAQWTKVTDRIDHCFEKSIHAFNVVGWN